MKKAIKTKLLWTTAIILGGWIFYIFRKSKSCDDLKSECPYFNFQEVMRLTNLAEGGLSCDSNDNASSQMTNFENGIYTIDEEFSYSWVAPEGYLDSLSCLYHTNKGLTWYSYAQSWQVQNPTYVGDAKTDINVYYQFINSNIDSEKLEDILARFKIVNPNLLPMSMTIGNKHDYLFPLESVFWQYTWGSGATGGKNQLIDWSNQRDNTNFNSIVEIQQFYRKKMNDQIYYDDMQQKNCSRFAIDKRIFALELAIECYEYRRDVVLPSLDDWSIYGNGWTRRCNRYITSLNDTLSCLILTQEGK